MFQNTPHDMVNEHRQTPRDPATPTCVDDNADDGFCVSDGASPQQQVFFIQPGLLPTVVYAVEEQWAHVTWMLTCASQLKPRGLGEGRPGRWTRRRAGKPEHRGLVSADVCKS